MDERPRAVSQVYESREPKLTIRIIGRCGFRCPDCSAFSGPERPGLLSISHFRQIISLLVEHDFNGVLNISGGETTFHPQLLKIVSLASRHLPWARIVVFTNGDWVGRQRWRSLLKSLLQYPNVLVRFSLDKEHAEGKARAVSGSAGADRVAEIEKERLEKARLFLEACRKEGAKPGLNYDFAFKGTISEGQAYMASLGDVPIYPLFFQRNPASRPKQMGFLAVDLDRQGRPLVFLTLGHLSREEPLGGLDQLPLALAQNREALKGLA
jgi:hypothetical protein